MQEKRLQQSKQSVLSSGDAYANPPAILDTMGRGPENPDKVNALGGSSSVISAIGGVILAAALLAGAFGLDGGSTPTSTSQVHSCQGGTI
jgi:hypothetical protein